jgi:predicted AlkP superfamily pyrophosphatase or phosphodiesterase
VTAAAAAGSPPPPLVVIDVVGLTPDLLAHMPRLRKIGEDGYRATLGTVLPAVTCSAQATFLTGKLPREHGIVGNGWFFRDLSEVWLWRQSNRLVAGEKVWEAARRKAPGRRVTCAQMFWWYAMATSADWSVTPRPVYFADGKKAPGIYSQPHDLKYELERANGEFPLFQFWGPGAGIASSAWIAAASRQVFDAHRPSLTLVYLPHLDYDLQRFGPDGPEARRAAAEIDRVAGDLCDHVRSQGARVVVLSEYGIGGVRRQVHINRRLREAGLLEVTHNAAGELLDFGASRAFAVADHQVAHVYVRDADARALGAAREALAGMPGIAEILDDAGGGKRAAGLDHERAGELVCVADEDAWFTYYYWLDDGRAPDFARSVEIHRKPGYDPAELFFDGGAAKARAALRLAQKKLGFRYVMDVVPMDGAMVRGSHGRLPDKARPGAGPVWLCSDRAGGPRESVAATEVFGLLLGMLTGEL